MNATWLVATGTALLSALLCRSFLDPSSRLHVLDQPGHRSLHHRPVPRSGGVAMVLALLAGWWLSAVGNAWWSSDVLVWMSAGVVLLALVGAWDDRHDLSPGLRLVAQTVAALMVIPAGLVPQALQLPGMAWSLPFLPALLLVLLFVLWMTNLYNFMDGMDGLAGTMTLIGFGTLAWIGFSSGADGLATTALMVAAATAGFLWFNFPPARIFMGDAGAPVLGFVAALLLLWADRLELLPLWQGVLLFSPFVVDATWTLARRLLRGDPVWKAHRSHLYQKLVLHGWSHRHTLLWSSLLMLACALTVILLQGASVQLQQIALLAWSLAWPLLILVVEQIAGRPA